MQAALARSVSRSQASAEPAERSDALPHPTALLLSEASSCALSATSPQLQSRDQSTCEPLFFSVPSSPQDSAVSATCIAKSPKKRLRAVELLSTASDTDLSESLSPSGSPRTKLPYYYKQATFEEASAASPEDARTIASPDCGRYFVIFETDAHSSPPPPPKYRARRLFSAPSMLQSPQAYPVVNTTVFSPAPLFNRRLDGISQWTSASPSSDVGTPSPSSEHSLPRSIPTARPSTFPSQSWSSPSASSYGQRIRVLILVTEERPFTGIIRDFKRKYNDVLEGRCDFTIQEVLNDAAIRMHVLRYNPTVIVTTGSHWMQMVLSGLVEERRIHDQKLQSVDSLHGQLIQVSVCGAVRYLFPLVGFSARRSSSSGSPVSSPRKSETQQRRRSDDYDGLKSARRNLTEIFMQEQEDVVMTEDRDCPSPRVAPAAAAVAPSSQLQRTASGSGSNSPTRSCAVGESAPNILDSTTETDINKLMLFLSEQVSALTPPGGSPSSAYDTFYGARRSSVPPDVNAQPNGGGRTS